jgi:hypothetical protein
LYNILNPFHELLFQGSNCSETVEILHGENSWNFWNALERLFDFPLLHATSAVPASFFDGEAGGRSYRFLNGTLSQSSPVEGEEPSRIHFRTRLVFKLEANFFSISAIALAMAP